VVIYILKHLRKLGRTSSYLCGVMKYDSIETNLQLEEELKDTFCN